MEFNWTCPHCLRAQTVVRDRFDQTTSGFDIGSIAGGPLAIEITAIGCSNPECRKLTLSVRIGKDMGEDDTSEVSHTDTLFSAQVIPMSAARPQPKYIPAVLVEDYTEACLIRDLSPKASATLTRRCLQGMIRDFARIVKPRLIDEIQALTAAVEDGSADRAITVESVSAIEHVRGIGNIGAHMEKDINTILPVDPGEAQAMIELVEMLFDEWYGARHRRAERLAKIAEISATKSQLKHNPAQLDAQPQP